MTFKELNFGQWFVRKYDQGKMMKIIPIQQMCDDPIVAIDEDGDSYHSNYITDTMEVTPL